MPTLPTTDVEVRADAYVAGQLPGVCIVSGHPATTSPIRTARSSSGGAAVIGLLFGLLPYLLLRGSMTKSVEGRLPLSDQASKADTAFARQRRRNALSAVALLALGVVSILASNATATGPTTRVFDANTGRYTTHNPNSASLAFGFLAAVLIVSAVFSVALAFRSPAAWVNPTFLPDRGVVVLHHAHPAFAQAIAQMPYLAGATTSAFPMAAWHPDPYGRAQSRYWDGFAWTAYVTGPGGSGYDPI